HAYMESWAMAVDNPYYAITGEDGTFVIPDIPPGTYTLEAWHPAVGKTLTQSVQVPADGFVEVSFAFEAPKGRRSAHELEENPRFGLELLGRNQSIVPSVRLQRP
ncbi:MAG: carboxypeptidase regulatory-like domain-containing protein, partial [Nitrospirae bacterium]